MLRANLYSTYQRKAAQVAALPLLLWRRHPQHILLHGHPAKTPSWALGVMLKLRHHSTGRIERGAVSLQIG